MPKCKSLQRVCAVNAIYTAYAAKRRTGLYRHFPCDLHHSAYYNTRPTNADITPPAPRWSISQRRSASSTYQIPAPRRALYSSAQPPIIIRYIRSAPLLWTHARRCSIPQTMPARRVQRLHCQSDNGQPGSVSILPTPGGWRSGTGQLSGRTGSAWHPPHGGAVQQQERGGRRGTIGGCRRISFRAFAR